MTSVLDVRTANFKSGLLLYKTGANLCYDIHDAHLQDLIRINYPQLQKANSKDFCTQEYTRQLLFSNRIRGTAHIRHSTADYMFQILETMIQHASVVGIIVKGRPISSDEPLTSALLHEVSGPILQVLVLHITHFIGNAGMYLL